MKHPDAMTFAIASSWTVFAVTFAYVLFTDQLYPFGWAPFLILFICPLWQLLRGPKQNAPPSRCS